MMKNYNCLDVSEKARSISRTFSHGHVQYGGRGVVHRLDWPFQKVRRIRDIEEIGDGSDARLTEDLTRVEGVFGADAIKRGCVACVNYLLRKESLAENVVEGFFERVEKLEGVRGSDIAGDDFFASRPRREEIGEKRYICGLHTNQSLLLLTNGRTLLQPHSNRTPTPTSAAALLRRRGLRVAVDVRQVVTGETEEEKKKREREAMLKVWEKRRKTKNNNP